MNPFPYAHRYRNFPQDSMPEPKKTQPLRERVEMLLVRAEELVLAEDDHGGKVDRLPARERLKMRALLTVLVAEFGGEGPPTREKSAGPELPRDPRKPRSTRRRLA